MNRYLLSGDCRLALSSVHGIHTANAQAQSLDTPPQESLPFDSEATNSTSLKSLVQSVTSEAEKTVIGLALEKTRWNRKAAARLLSVSYRTLLYKIERYHMIAPQAYNSHLLRNEMKGNGRVS